MNRIPCAVRAMAAALLRFQILALAAVIFSACGSTTDSLSALESARRTFESGDSAAAVVELKALFGRNKQIRLSPEIEGGGISMNRWVCSSNLSSNYLPWSCEGI